MLGSRRSRFGRAALAAAALLLALSAGAATSKTPLAALYGQPPAPGASGEYMVIFKGVPEDADVRVSAALTGALATQQVAPEVADAIDSAVAGGAELTQTYAWLLKGFAARLDAKQLDALRHNPSVDALYESVSGPVTSGTQSPADWGLDRIDQANLPLDNSYTYPNTAPNVNLYVVDSGLRLTHQEFKDAAGTASRASGVWNTFDNNSNVGDCQGHGTQVTSVAAGRTKGAAKDVRIFVVKGVDCTGNSNVAAMTAALDRVAQDVTDNNRKPAVVSWSINWYPADPAGGTAIEVTALRMISKGIHLVNSAGNANVDALTNRPARLGLGSASIVVGNSTNADVRYSVAANSGSNWGPALNLFAPGTGINTALALADTTYTTQTGTSLSAPYVAGAAALCLASNTTLSPAQLKARLVNCSTTSVLQAATLNTGTPNRLLNVNACGCTAGPTYSDMASSYWAYPAVSCLDKYGIGFPCEATKYCGTTALKRWEMAVYIVEAKQDEANLPTYKNYFTDVPANEWWTTYVERFKELNITAGCGPGLFCPNNSVTRADMAVFIIKAIGQTPLTTYKGYFTDVPAGQYYTGYVEKAKELGIIAGCTSTTYCPTQNVTREQTASIVRNAFSSSLTCP